MSAVDLAACRAAIRTGSRSFHAASLLMPSRFRNPALALYAFCRSADDAVDLGGGVSVAALHERLDGIYAGRPGHAPADRAFAAAVAAHGLPRALPEALLEGFAWDIEGRRYRTLSDVRAYGARVAGSVGVMMCVLLGRRDRDALARAADLGVAMQLTNIVRDVAEDAAAGRVYLPTDWLAAEGIDAGDVVASPAALMPVLRRLLAEADRLYARADAGVGSLPAACRPSVLAARHIYRAIGGRVLRDGPGRRARTSGAAKAALAARALADAARISALPRSAVLHAAPLLETAFLVEAACGGVRSAPWGEGRPGMLLGVFASLAARDRDRRLVGPIGDAS